MALSSLYPSSLCYFSISLEHTQQQWHERLYGYLDGWDTSGLAHTWCDGSFGRARKVDPALHWWAVSPWWSHRARQVRQILVALELGFNFGAGREIVGLRVGCPSTLWWPQLMKSLPTEEGLSITANGTSFSAKRPMGHMNRIVRSKEN